MNLAARRLARFLLYWLAGSLLGLLLTWSLAGFVHHSFPLDQLLFLTAFVLLLTLLASWPWPRPWNVLAQVLHLLVPVLLVILLSAWWLSQGLIPLAKVPASQQLTAWTALQLQAQQVLGSWYQHLHSYYLFTTRGVTVKQDPLTAASLVALLAWAWSLLWTQYTTRRLKTAVPWAAAALLFSLEWLFFWGVAARQFLLFNLGLAAYRVLAVWLLPDRSQGRSENQRQGWWQRRLAHYMGSGLALVFLGLAMTATWWFAPALQPLDTGKIGEQVVQHVPVLQQLRGGHTAPGPFTLAGTGFGSDNGVLGAPVSLNNSDALQLTVKGPVVPSTIYLRGQVFDEYTGTGWQRSPQLAGSTQIVATGTAIPTAVLQDTKVLASACDSCPPVTPKMVRVQTFQGSLGIQPQGNYTKTLFSPLEAAAVQADGSSWLAPGEKPQVDIDRALVLSMHQAWPPGTPYTIKTRYSRYQPSSYANMPGYLNPTLALGSQGYSNLFGGDNTEVPFTDHALPQTTARVQNLASSIAGPSAMQISIHRSNRRLKSISVDPSDYYQVATAIQDYLRKNYQYTLTPKIPQALAAAQHGQPTPPGFDFVDSFLFDTQQGYCVYFSTAMVVMLRSLGIPARWVTGYAVPVQQLNESQHGSNSALPTAVVDGQPLSGYLDASKGVTLEVSNAYAHAWVEAYMPGFGWVTFDPTPRFQEPVYQQAQNSSSSTSSGSTASSTSNGPQTPDRGPLGQAGQLDQGAPAGANAAGSGRSFPWGWVTLFSLLVVVAAAAWLTNSRQALRWRARGDRRLEALLVYEAAANEVGAAYSRRKNGETASEYVERLGNDSRVPRTTRQALRQLTTRFENTYYGAETGDIRPLYHQWNVLHRHLVEDLGDWSLRWLRLRQRLTSR